MIETAAKLQEPEDEEDGNLFGTNRNVDQLIKELDKEMDADGEDNKLIEEDDFDHRLGVQPK
jgi:hypothetical protein